MFSCQLLKVLPVLQAQVDSLLEFDVSYLMFLHKSRFYWSVFIVQLLSHWFHISQLHHTSLTKTLMSSVSSILGCKLISFQSLFLLSFSPFLFDGRNERKLAW